MKFVILGILIDLLSICASKKISEIIANNHLILLAKKGLKLNNVVYIDYINKHGDKIEEFFSKKPFDIINNIISVFPIINIIYAFLMSKICLEKSKQLPGYKDALVPMSEDEIIFFNTLKTNSARLNFIYLMDYRMNNNDLDNVIIIGGSTYCITEPSTYIFSDPLDQISYTYDEIKILADATETKKVSFGIMDGIHTALLGYTGDDNFRNVKLKRDEFSKIYEFKKISDEDAQNYHYVAYCVRDYYRSVLDEAVTKIKAERNNEIKTYNEISNIDQICNLDQGHARVRK